MLDTEDQRVKAPPLTKKYKNNNQQMQLKSVSWDTSLCKMYWIYKGGNKF